MMKLKFHLLMAFIRVNLLRIWIMNFRRFMIFAFLISQVCLCKRSEIVKGEHEKDFFYVPAEMHVTRISLIVDKCSYFFCFYARSKDYMLRSIDTKHWNIYFSLSFMLPMFPMFPMFPLQQSKTLKH